LVKNTGGTTLYAFDYWYDESGRRRVKTESPNKATYYEYNAADELVRSHHHPDESWAYFHYDADGNTTSVECPAGGDAGPQGTTYYTWNQSNLMTGATVPGVQAANAFEWNAAQQRTRKVDTSGDVQLLRDGQKVVAERTGDGTLTARYANEGPSLYSALLSDKRSGSTVWPVFDMLGTVQSVANSSQVLSGSTLWEAFGTKAASTGALPGPFGYVGALGYYNDADLGMPLLSIRHYAPRRGMFVSRDPALEEAAYGYVGALPLSAADPSGQWGVCFGVLGSVFMGWGFSLPPFHFPSPPVIFSYGLAVVVYAGVCVVHCPCQDWFCLSEWASYIAYVKFLRWRKGTPGFVIGAGIFVDATVIGLFKDYCSTNPALPEPSDPFVAGTPFNLLSYHDMKTGWGGSAIWSGPLWSGGWPWSGGHPRLPDWGGAGVGVGVDAGFTSGLVVSSSPHTWQCLRLPSGGGGSTNPPGPPPTEPPRV
jgi:RHS repeat-associated protein